MSSGGGEQVRRCRCGWWGVFEQGSVDDVGQSALERAESFGAGVVELVLASFEIGAGVVVAALWVTAMRWMAALS